MQDMPRCIQVVYTRKQFVFSVVGDKYCNVVYNDNIFILIKENTQISLNDIKFLHS